MNKNLLILLFNIICLVAISQQTEDIYLHRDYAFDYNYQADTTAYFHTSVKPYKRANFKGALNTKQDGIGKIGNNNSIHILPIADVVSGYDVSKSDYAGFLGAGLDVMYEHKQKLGLNIQYNHLQAQPLSYIDSSIQQYKIIDGFSRVYQNSMGAYGDMITGYISYSPNKIFNLQAGRGKNFFGDGYRSLLLSDNAMPMPYFRITTDVWHIKYINLFAQQTDIRGIYEYNKKYTATHYLDWAISKKVNLSLFETVVWLQKDTLLSRGLEVNYLNPIIFYRPVEYSVGSSDNVLMGLNFKVRVGNKTTLYSQIILDEFLLDQVKADTGWWANKYGGQLGVKSYDVAGIKGLYAQAEFNAVRPFTYSHSNSLRGLTPINTIQNYAHANQPMAHPLGASFYDYFLLVRYQKDKWLFENKMNLSEFGTDTNARSLGHDLYKSYSLRAKEFRNTTAQGLHHVLFQNELRAAYLVSKQYNFWIGANLLFRSVKTPYNKEDNLYFSISLKTAVFNRCYDY